MVIFFLQMVLKKSQYSLFLSTFEKIKAQLTCEHSVLCLVDGLFTKISKVGSKKSHFLRFCVLEFHDRMGLFIVFIIKIESITFKNG